MTTSEKVKFLNKKYNDIFIKLGEDLSKDVSEMFNLDDPEERYLASLITQRVLHFAVTSAELISNVTLISSNKE